MAYANVIFKTVLPVATGFGLWYLLIDRGNNTIREEFEKSHGKGKAKDASPLIRNSEKELMVKTILGGRSSSFLSRQLPVIWITQSNFQVVPPTSQKSEKKRPKSVDKLPKSITNYRWKRGISETLFKIAFDRLAKDFFHFLDQCPTPILHPLVIILKSFDQKVDRIRQDRQVVFTTFLNKHLNNIKNSQANL